MKEMGHVTEGLRQRIKHVLIRGTAVQVWVVLGSEPAKGAERRAAVVEVDLATLEKPVFPPDTPMSLFQRVRGSADNNLRRTRPDSRQTLQ